MSSKQHLKAVLLMKCSEHAYCLLQQKKLCGFHHLPKFPKFQLHLGNILEKVENLEREADIALFNNAALVCEESYCALYDRIMHHLLTSKNILPEAVSKEYWLSNLNSVSQNVTPRQQFLLTLDTFNLAVLKNSRYLGVAWMACYPKFGLQFTLRSPSDSNQRWFRNSARHFPNSD
jgi:hypothetical protein